jgi:hypothetical protein
MPAGMPAVPKIGGEMSTTTNYNLNKYTAGESGWANGMNTNMDKIDQQMKANYDAFQNGLGNKIDKNADITPGTYAKVTVDAKGLVTGGTPLTAEDVPEIPVSKITGLEEILDALVVDPSAVTVSARCREIPGFLDISAQVIPKLPVSFWRAIISVKDGNSSSATPVEVATVESTSNIINVNFDIMAGVEPGDYIYVKVLAFFGSDNYKESNEYRLRYQGYTTPIDQRLTHLENNLTIDNVVSAIKSDETLLTLIANHLQNSNTLARKVAEESQTQASS